MGLANVLARSNKVGTYKGKLIIAANGTNTCLFLQDAEADQIVADNWPFSYYKSAANAGPPYTMLKFDDNTPVTLEDTISVNEVPDDAEAWFVLEPAYVMST